LILTLERAGLSTTGKSQAASISRMEWLQVAVGTQIRMLHVSDVIYFESDTKYTRVVAEDCDGLIRISLKELLESLDSSTFLQTHRSSLVNRRFVHSVHRKGEVVEIELKGRPERLKVSIANHHIFKAM
ncbi:MAG TPA: LytTR family DNA-binding domain-containing protein, partial [Rhodoferax sp.]|nr:LytTR family DNA-binding domain-containing protein [Rhodoferax sp.]